MNNPLSTAYDDSNDKLLIEKATNGDKNALNELIKAHEKFIYNVAWKFTNDQQDASDLTQEVLIKVITKLSTFKGKSAFRTWLYRIVFNQFMQSKRKPMEDRWESFDDFANQLNAIPSPELSPEEEIEQEYRTKTARVRCMSGMLMCLTREQRLIYVLGDVFQIDHNIGAEIFKVSKENYRKKLSRTRKEFHAFMNKQCGLVNLDNPCRCSKKAKAMEAAGRMQTNVKLFDPKFSATIAKYAESVADEVADVVDRKYIEFFQQHPTKEDFDAKTVIDVIINDKEYQKYFDEINKGL
ncbi:MAG: sigma-70 family RNA polymerase sigma factor [Bacteroidetes bacterium]|nr:MAG: sigma-70 family RNA polymerase sigma factor [Bacteroidota bacterium]